MQRDCEPGRKLREGDERRWKSPRKIWRVCRYGHPCSVDVIYLLLRRGLWVRTARKARWLALCKMLLDVVGHPGHFGIMHFDLLRIETHWSLVMLVVDSCVSLSTASCFSCCAFTISFQWFFHATTRSFREKTFPIFTISIPLNFLSLDVCLCSSTGHRSRAWRFAAVFITVMRTPYLSLFAASLEKHHTEISLSQ